MCLCVQGKKELNEFYDVTDVDCFWNPAGLHDEGRYGFYYKYIGRCDGG